ncbi:MAG: hypothetical protein KGD68_03035 [Candidatus Lokiarchaeota archaeon]|nr:hypothetical protein [Candidatus Lokiarchaeota archaeon]
MISKKLLQWLNIVTFIAAVIINYLAISLPLGYGSTQKLSDDIPNLFVPSGLTFSIWGIIYILLGIFSVYQLRDIFKSEKIEMPYLGKISYFFIISNLTNFSWILLWHYKLVPLSLVAMFIILVSLLLIYIRLDIGKTEVSRTEKIAVHAPFSVYLGWITVATIANVTAVLADSTGFFKVVPDDLLAEILTILVIAVAVLITYLMLFLRKDWVYSLVIVWAVLGIYLKQSGLIAITALIAVIIVAIGIVYTGFKLLRK